ncbi:MAG: GspE/PulE family protein [Candidatus Velthaea sp.]
MAITRSVPASAPAPELTMSGDALARIPRSFAFRHDVLALDVHDGVLTIAVADPADETILDHVRSATRLRIRPVEMAREEIRERLRLAYGSDSTAFDRRPVDAPAVRAVDEMFVRAISEHASDIHVEPRTSGARIRLRIDGILRETEPIAPELFAPFVSRIKLIAGMDIADKRQPQDGRYTVTFEQREIDARVSSIPTINGEKLVIRILDHHAQAPDLGRLGLPAPLLARYRRLVQAPWGFIVVTGPTGSGKTTTLYASLAELDSTSKNISSVEDPIEMRVRGVSQVQVNPRAGLSFPGILRSFMRQDPNVIMVGEMRDAETAAVAISASLAGQLVFTTLHANDAPRTIERLVELGVARHSLAAGLTAVVAQRLVRRLCEQCRVTAAIPAHARPLLGNTQATWFVAGDCRACRRTGYTGRIGVYELLLVTDEMREAIAGGASSVTIAQLGRACGYTPMIADGIQKVLAGDTSFDELMRVVAWSEEV